MTTPEFTSLEPPHLVVGQRVFAVRNQEETMDFGYVFRKDVLIDGVQHHVTSVAHYAHLPPWHVGEVIGLGVRSKADNNSAPLNESPP